MVQHAPILTEESQGEECRAQEYERPWLRDASSSGITDSITETE